MLGLISSGLGLASSIVDTVKGSGGGGEGHKSKKAKKQEEQQRLMQMMLQAQQKRQMDMQAQHMVQSLSQAAKGQFPQQ